jgi:hypothetical protein
MLGGVEPIPAKGDQVTTPHRLNRYGDRQLNNGLDTVVQSAIQYQSATRECVAGRTAEGESGREINAALPATSPATSIAYWKRRPQLLDEA